MRFLVAILIAGSVVVGPATAGADEVGEAREHYKKGTKAFELGAYDEAIAEYSAAYRLRDDPALLYNLAQAHRLANHAAEALRFYRLFLMKVPAATNRDEVEDKIRELQKLVDQQRKTQNLPPDSVKAPGAVQSPEPTVPAASAPAAAPVETAAPPSGETAHAGRTKLIAGIAVATVGVGALVGGLVAGVLAQNAGDKLTQLDRARQSFDYGQQQAGKTDTIAEGVLLGVGAAAVVSGGVLVVLGLRERRHARQLSFAPAVGRSVAGASLSGTF
jgi:tetratricopeptide (TPR) repeat protein